jgi:hypothetical protein
MKKKIERPHREQGDPITLLLFFQNKKSRRDGGRNVINNFK